MKNMKKLAVISLVVMMMVTAVGYAAWSDSVTAVGTVVSGTFGVKFDKADSQATQGVSYTHNDDKATFTVGNVIPGEQRLVRLAVKNEGSVPAYLNPTDLIILPTLDWDNVWLQFKVDASSALYLAPAGQAGDHGYLDITFEMDPKKPLVVNAIDGMMTPFSDEWSVTANYSQTQPK